jgi:hypothetical protein
MVSLRNLFALKGLMILLGRTGTILLTTRSSLERFRRMILIGRLEIVQRMDIAMERSAFVIVRLVASTLVSRNVVQSSGCCT